MVIDDEDDDQENRYLFMAFGQDNHDGNSVFPELI